MEVKMEHVKNLTKDSENLKVLVKGEVTGRTSLFGKTVYQVDTETSDSFEVCEDCVFEDITKPVEVPQFVADWYENSKMVLDYAIWDVIQSNAKGNVQSEELNNWIENTEDAIIILVKMYLFGYKVKKDKKYLVKLKGVLNGTKALKHNIREDSWYMGIVHEFNGLEMYHTKEELKAGGFGGVFDNPMFEVKEME